MGNFATGFRAEIGEHRLTVLLDIRNPLAYLALGPTVDLGKEHSLQINWLPCEGQLLHAPSEPGSNDDRSVIHKRSRAQAIALEIQIYGEAQGLVLREYYRAGDPNIVHAAWLWVRAQRPSALEALLSESFRSYWACETDPSDVDAIAKLVESVGADGTAFRNWLEPNGRAALAATNEEVRARGLAGVPGYFIDDEVFWGRQHLPMIRWILGGREGHGPI